MRKQKLSVLAILGALVLALAGCAQDNTNTTDNNPQQSDQTDQGATQSTEKKSSGGAVALAADPSGGLKYEETSLSAGAGDVSIDFTNDSSTPHNVTVEDASGKKLGATDDITKSSATLDLKGLKAGDYTFFCSVPGHEQAGMKGTLTVK
ncbi:MAG: plastocyanin/azurin family copper-binding protein [Solirubrobacterales bacterium]